MRPLMYGYMRVDLVSGEVSEWEERIRNFAAREGFDLGTVFHEPGPDRPAFNDLIHELRRAECRHVVVPAMSHVWHSGPAPGSPGRHRLVARLWEETGAGVWVADPEANRISVRVADRHRSPRAS
ncbi:MAG: recombinase family protein [Mycobacteriaceae bacterium]|nr:recombinase family protein [Mycobacteriaceae bacterium]